VRLDVRSLTVADSPVMVAVAAVAVAVAAANSNGRRGRYQGGRKYERPPLCGGREGEGEGEIYRAI